MKKIILFKLSLLLTFSFTLAQTVVLDFEEGGTSAAFQYFGSTLDGSTNSIIDNPDQSGINNSARVADFVKPAGSEVWAGAFAIEPGTVDLTSDNQICIKVWMEQAGNLALKLENSPIGSPNWISTLDVNEAQTWVELCYNAELPSEEGPFEPAAGGSYNGIVLFFDFGTSPSEDRNYYFDDIITQTGTAMPVDVTFSVDMNNYTGSIGTVYVSGTFNSWSGDANPLSDNDGDGIWEGTITGIEAGAHEYKFTIDNWTDQEMFNFSGNCTVTDPSGQFTNRSLIASVSETLPTVCFNSCYLCGQGVVITINLGQGGIAVSDEGLYIAGGGNFGNPGDYPLNDNGDGTHTIVLERPIGFESYYTFTNGACGDFSCKENIAGQDCADPNNFNDRFMGPITEDTVIGTCFGACTTDTNCDGGPQPGDITFQVDMSTYTGDFTTAYVSGTFNNWSGDANPLADDDGDGIWETTIPLSSGTYEYKFQLDAWSVPEEFAEGEPCTITDPSGAFVNRSLEVDGTVTVCFLWNTCTACDVNSIFDLNVANNIFNVQPTIVQDEVLLTFDNRYHEKKELTLINAVGQVIEGFRIAPNITQQFVDMHRLDNGIYFIRIQTEGKIQTQKIIIQK